MNSVMERVAKAMAVALGLAWGLGFTSVRAGTLDRDLAQTLGMLASGEKISVIVQMVAQADLRAAAAGIGEARKVPRGRAVIEALQASASSQGPLTAFLQAEQAAGRVEGIKSFTIFNGLALRATKQVVATIATRPDVALISEDRMIQLPPTSPGEEEAAVNAAEWNIDRIRAPKVWTDFGNRGQGSVAGVLDTGFDPHHPDLAPRWRGGANSWLDAVNGSPNPYDDNGHGSHTTGTSIGGNAGGTDIGVAPDAQFIACKAFNSAGSGSTGNILECMQWFLDPDGNPATADFPDAVNNSWGRTNPGCFRTFQLAVEAWVAAGIFPSFSAGNSGPGAMTGGSPAVYEESFAVGATDINDVIAGFSSRGPSSCDGTTFPEVSAPGVNVRSSVPGSGYANFSGTSMAAPHVTGCVLLIESARPAATIKQKGNFLKKKAVDLGAVGPDNVYGSGRIDCFKAVKKAMQALP